MCICCSNSQILTSLPQRVVLMSKLMGTNCNFTSLFRGPNYFVKDTFFRASIGGGSSKFVEKKEPFQGLPPRAPQYGVTPRLGDKMGGYWPIPNLMSPNQYLKVLFKMIRQEYCSNDLRPSPPSVTKVIIVLIFTFVLF